MTRSYGIGKFLFGSLILSALFWLQPAAHAASSNPNKLRATLTNGLRVVIVRNDLAPVVTTELNYLVGSDEAPQGFPGMAHAQEHMMFRGSPELSAAQLADISAAMGGEFDADTQQSVTQYFFTVPAEDLNVALHIGALRMRGVLDKEALWNKERGAIEQEVARDFSNPEYVMYSRLLAAMFEGTPYEHDALGTRASFDKTTGRMLKQFHHTWYVPNNAILVVVGHLDLQKTLAEIKRLYGSIPMRKLPPRPKVKLRPVKPQWLHMKTDSPYGLTAIAWRTPGYDNKDYAASQVLADVLNNPRSRLFDLVTNGKALETGFENGPLPHAGMGIAYAAFSKGADSDALMKALQKTLAGIIRDGVNPDMVAAARRQERVDFEGRKNSIPGLASVYSQALAVEHRHSPADDLAAIERVTVADVNRVAKHYLDTARVVRVTLTPQNSGKVSTAHGFGGKESFTPSKTRQVSLPDWASQALGKLNIPASAINPVVKEFPNGLNLIVQPETISNTISVYGRIHNRPDVEEPKDQAGVDQVLEQLFDYGSRHLNRIAFQKALDKIGATESAGTDFSLTVLAPQFNRGVELLADNELNPALPEHAFQVIRSQQAHAVAGKLDSPGFLMSQALKRGMFPATDPSLRHATPATVSRLSQDDVKAYFQKVFRPDLTTIVVIGKVTPKQAEAVIGKYFGAWKATGPKPQVDLPAVPDNGPLITHVPDPSSVQDEVLLGESLRLTRFNPDRFALELGNHVLGGAFYATRLYHDLREESGLVYTVESFFEYGRNRSVYLAEYACDPDNVKKSRTILVHNLKRMREEPVSAEELHRAKALLLRKIPLSEASISDIASGLLDRADKGLPLDEPTSAAQHYVALNAKQVQEAFVKWLRPGDLVQASKGPQPK